MSLASYYIKKCTDKLEENASLLLAKLSDPASLVDVNISGALADAAAGGMGDLAAFAADYAQENADVLVLEALQAAGLEDSVLSALNLFYNMIAQAMAAYNDLILLYMKKLAVQIQKNIDTKTEINLKVRAAMVQLVNSLSSLDQGDPVFDNYLKQLRAALIQVDSGRRDMRTVRNTLSAQNTFLTKLYRTGKKKLIAAQEQIRPPTDSEQIIFTEKKDGITHRATPTQLTAPTGSTDQAEKVKVGDTVVVVGGGKYVNKGNYIIKSKIDNFSWVLNKNVFNTAINDNVVTASGVDFYIKGIVSDTALAIGTAVVKQAGIPTEPAQIQNMLAIPKLCKNVIVATKGYGAATTDVNNGLVFYFAGLQVLQDAIPDIMKKQVLGLFDTLLERLGSLVSSMASHLNGTPGAIGGPLGKFKPDVLDVSTNAFKWAMDIGIIVESLKLIPAEAVVVQPKEDGMVQKTSPNTLFSGPSGNPVQFTEVQKGDTVTITGGKFVIPGDYVVMLKGGDNTVILDRNAYNVNVFPGPGETDSPHDVQFYIVTDGALAKFQLNLEIVNVYKKTVALIKKKGNRTDGQGALIAFEGQENFIVFQGQLIAFMLEALSAITSSSVRPGVISEGKALIHHLDLAIQQDTEIKNILQEFIDTPIPLEDTLEELFNGLNKLLSDLGLDKAADLLNSGDFAGFFSLNGKNATYIGAALETIAFLKDCFDNEADKAKLTETENAIKGEQDLLNIKVTFNFDLAILNNLADCLNLNNLAGLLTTKEFLCGLAESAGLGKAFDAVEDLVTFSNS